MIWKSNFNLGILKLFGLYQDNFLLMNFTFYNMSKKFCISKIKLDFQNIGIGILNFWT